MAYWVGALATTPKLLEPDLQNPPGGRADSCKKRAPDLITDGCEPPCGCRELNSGPLEEPAMLLTTEPSLQPR
ncbi:hypothetical protein LEMLEM_LOCUS1840 [Lemmus lemmus]